MRGGQGESRPLGVSVGRPNQDRGRGAGFIPQEREHRTSAPAKFQSLLRSTTPADLSPRSIARAATTLPENREGRGRRRFFGLSTRQARELPTHTDLEIDAPRLPA